ncbi:MAG: uracil-DNA glycosylase [Verrucomicrobia bacterium]|nr:uracil-DNA glycosylase [Verrucomicrobiota bacterium]
MRTALTALTDELKRLKSTGVKSVAVSEESVAALRRVIAARRSAAMPAAESPRTEPASAPRPSASAPVSMPVSAPVRPAPAPKPPEAEVRKLPAPPVVTLPPGDKTTRWAWLREQVLTNPVCAANVRPGKKIVLGVGSLDAKIMFVGEAPGAEEEIQGEPFVGPAGQLLTRMIGGMGLKREEVYIGNIMNWRPQMPVAAGAEQVGNRPPTPEELAFCLPFLRAQIEIVNPLLIVALGSTAAQGLLGADSFKTLGEIRGRWQQFAGKPVMVTYHPSYILRNASNRSKRMVWEDLLQVMDRAGMPISDKQRGYYLDK